MKDGNGGEGCLPTGESGSASASSSPTRCPCRYSAELFADVRWRQVWQPILTCYDSYPRGKNWLANSYPPNPLNFCYNYDIATYSVKIYHSHIQHSATPQIKVHSNF